MNSKLLLTSIFVCFCLSFAAGQQNLVYNHYFINPFLYNPSFIAQSGYSELYINYRKQWSGFEGAPQTGTLNLQLPLNYKAGFAVTGYQDKAGIITTTTGLLSFSYQIFLGKKLTELHKIGFGLSAGYTNSRLESDESNDFSDPVLGNQTSSLDGQFGMHYQYNGFKLAFAIPRLFDKNVAAEQEFTTKGISQIHNTISSISYDFKLSPMLSVEPMVSYRTYEVLDPQYEVLTSLKLLNVGWIGGAYRQDYGAFGFLGVNIKEKIKVGYAYEFATDQADRMGQGSHEVQLVWRLGKKQFTRPQALGKTKVTQPAKESALTQTDPNEEESTEPKVEENISQPAIAEQKDVSPKAPVTNPVQQQPNEVITDNPKETPKLPVRKLDGEGLAPGHYVVVGAFHSVQNAKTYAATLKRSGYPSNVAYHPEKLYYIVHMLNAPTIEEARMQRDKYRQMSRYSFRDTWILSIE